MNRVTGVYEKELSIRMVLVANNSNLVYTNSASDPYSNNDAFLLLGENQANVDAVIGNANYDIGHVFSTGGGGLAYLGVVGETGWKARGETGLPAPTGDLFYIDYVAHEVGHQFGANHTFNSAADPNANTETAYEPGSGSTIMGYAGITGDFSDLQDTSDAYFHSVSFDEIVGYVARFSYSGGALSATGNSVPTASAGPDRFIPASTPFALTGSATDANGDTLTYNWEQRDLGPSTWLDDPDNGSSPLFRSYTATTDPTRMFPRLPSVLSGQNGTNAPYGGLAERLPTLARAMDFRLTVRDNRAGGGAVNTDDVILNVVNTGSGFLINSHNTSASLAGGSFQTVTWNVAGTTANNINAASVNIRLSTDGGVTFRTLLSSATANDGSQQVQMPYNLGTTQARIKVEPTNNIFFDINNANLTITNVAPPASTAPGTPVLASASDTGTAGDNRTRFNNSVASKVLQFSVSGTISGALVEILAGGVVLGSATATGTTTVVTTTDTVTAGVNRTLADGSHNITARQTETDKPVSAQSAALAITVDATAPTANVIDVTPDPRTNAVPSVDILFSEAVTGLTVPDLSLTRGGVALTLGASQAPTTANNTTFTVPSLSDLTARAGTYVLTLTAAGSGIEDAAGNALAGNASDNWLTNSTVAGRRLFYNRSFYDGTTTSVPDGPNDDDAIATDKVALLPGAAAGFANYTSFSSGINGIMVDVAGLADAAGLVAADFLFTAGNDGTPSGWANAPAPASVTVRAGAGADGSDRITLVWADGAIKK